MKSINILESLDQILDQISMYRLVLYVLIFLIGIASFFGIFNLVPFSPTQIVFSAIFLTLVCWGLNKGLSKLLKYPVAIESSYITALILTLIVSPPTNPQGYFLLFEIGVLATASKYLFVINKRHIFNPAAIAVFLSGVFLNQSASWWVGTTILTPFVLACGLLIVRKLQFERLVFSFLLTITFSFAFFQTINGLSLMTGFQQLFLNSPVFFFAFIMLLEPSTLPPTKNLRTVYGSLIALLTTPQAQFGSFYFTPEIALLVGNIFSFLVGSKKNLILKFNQKKLIANDTFELFFAKEKTFDYKPGQYMEWTLPHKKTDSRGNRRFFTISSSPTENNLEISVKFYESGSSFKKYLLGISEGTTIKAGSLGGDFTLPKDKSKKLVFVAGGIGVTPYRSMVKYLLDKNEKRNIVLLYSNTNENEIAYREIFEQAVKKIGIKVVYFLTGDLVPTEWVGKKGRISKEAIAQEVSDYKERIFYISGPMPLVNAIKNELKELGVSRRNVKTDFFPGYA